MEEDDYPGYDDPERIRDIIYWTTLALRLPPDRIDVVFPTEDVHGYSDDVHGNALRVSLGVEF